MNRSLDCRVTVLISVLGLVLTTVGAHAATCRSTCAVELKACRRACTGTGGARRNCSDACAERSTCTGPGAPIGTLAYGVTDCITDTQGGARSLGQRLMIRRGNCDAASVPVLAATQLAPFEPCVGDRGGVIQRSVVLPDGSGVVFEVTNEFSSLPSIKDIAVPGKGMFFVRADGTGLRRLGEPSHAWVCGTINGSCQTDLFVIASSPDGRTVAFTDLGPGPDGRETDQIFTLDLASGRRRQLTLRPATDDLVPPRLSCVTFLNNRTVTFCNRVWTSDVKTFLIRDIFTVPTDGGRPGLEETVEIAAVGGGAVVPQFRVEGATRSIAVTGLFYPASPLDHYERVCSEGVCGVHIPAIEEVFLVNGANVLQLTNLDRAETTRAGRGGAVSGQRVFFNASANLSGANPDEYCQIFSVGVDGTGLKQLTRLTDAARPSRSGCFSPELGSCSIDRYFADRRSGTVLFTSDCNPIGENPFGSVVGNQVFAMRPDGSQLRQLTAWHATDTPPGTVQTYKNWPVAYQ